MTPDFLLTALVVVLIPGTGVVYTLSCGLLGGARASLWAALGCTFGIVPHLLASILGLAALLHASAVAFQAVKVAGVLYLLWLAFGLWRERGGLVLAPAGDRAGTAAARGGPRIALRGVLINILNPKLSIFFLAFLPQFVPAGTAEPLPLMALMSAAFMAMTFVVFVGYGLMAAAVRAKVADSPRVMAWLRRSFAAVIAGLGVRLAVAQQ